LQELFENKSTDESLNDQFDRYMTEYDTTMTSTANKVDKEPFTQDLLAITTDDYEKVIVKLDEFANSTMNFGEALLKKIDEIGMSSDSYFRETADKIAKNSVEISNSSLSFLKRTKEAIGQHLAARVSQASSDNKSLKDKASN
jgi:hypothetical protein